VVDQPIHEVDMYPTLAGLAGAQLTRNKPLDGMDVWATLSQGAPSPRQEVVYGIEPFRAALRVGGWKLIWQVTIPSRVELYNLAQDPGEQTNLADQNPSKVDELKARIEEQARGGVQPLIFSDALGVVRSTLFGSVLLPSEEKAVEQEP